jgi:hypothetical protein
MKQRTYNKYKKNKKSWDELLPNQKRWRLINTLQNKCISFWFVCGQETKNDFFKKVLQENANYDSIRQEMIQTYMSDLIKNKFAGNVEEKKTQLKVFLIVEEDTKTDV